MLEPATAALGESCIATLPARIREGGHKPGPKVDSDPPWNGKVNLQAGLHSIHIHQCQSLLCCQKKSWTCPFRRPAPPTGPPGTWPGQAHHSILLPPGHQILQAGLNLQIICATKFATKFSYSTLLPARQQLCKLCFGCLPPTGKKEEKKHP